MEEELKSCPFEATDDAGRDCKNNIKGLCVQRCVNKLLAEKAELGKHKQNLHEALLAKDKIQEQLKQEVERLKEALKRAVKCADCEDCGERENAGCMVSYFWAELQKVEQKQENKTTITFGDLGEEIDIKPISKPVHPCKNSDEEISMTLSYEFDNCLILDGKKYKIGPIKDLVEPSEGNHCVFSVPFNADSYNYIEKLCGKRINIEADMYFGNFIFEGFIIEGNVSPEWITKDTVNPQIILIISVVKIISQKVKGE